ncbi:MAG TPA: efflux RND transporter permease subunit [Brevibacterium senegalense]|uniref:Efflux RND transporter permease subunit n=1 Tax=Brevibacterium senegalense TaxID=1033736 RepID=A0A921MD28_9MICO|nr:efflux RND transporter permease subunit [Brevibacterium senegalense]
MLSLTRLSLRNRALIALITICAAVFGVIGTSTLKQELFPPLELPQAFVTAQYEGASPEAVEREVTAPLEEALTGVESVESIQSTSSAGSSQVVVETDYGTDSDEVVRSLQRAVSQVESTLPDGVEPSVMAGGLADFPIVMLSVSSSGDVNELASDLEDVAVPELSDIEGVRSVAVTGEKPLQVEITVREDDLEDEGVSIDSLAGLLQANGVPTSPGQLQTDEGSAPVEVGSRLTSVEQIEDLVVAGADGPVAVRDVADVELTEAPITSVSRTDGADSLMLQVLKTPDGNTVEVSHGVEEALPEIQEALGDDVEFVTLFDQAPFIEQSIEDLLVEGLLGLGFAVVIILVFLLSVRATIITAISIPVSLLITLIGLWTTGYTLNMLTLAALTISIGRVVDDSIVVVEAIRRRHSLGGDKAENIRAAVGEVATAITASTLVTVAVFLPVAFVGGQTGELFRPFALTASLALLASLFVALTIVPVLAYWFLSRRGKEAKLTRAQKKQWKAERATTLAQWRKERKEAAKRPIDPENPSGRRSTGELPVVPAVGEDRTEPQEIDELAAMHQPVTRLQKTYVPVVRWTLRHPVIVLLVAVLVFAGTLAMTPLLKTELLGDTGEPMVQVTQDFEPGTDLEEASEQAREVEAVMEDVDEISSSLVSISGGGDEFSMGSSGGTSAQYIVNLEEGTDAEAVGASLQEELDEIEGAGTIEVLSASSMGAGSTIDVRLTGNDIDQLEDAAAGLGEDLADVDGVQSVTDDTVAVQPVVEVAIDHEEAAEYGLTEQSIGQIVSRAMRGQQLGQLVIDDVGRSVLLFHGDIDNVQELREFEFEATPTSTDDQAQAAPETPGMPQAPVAPQPETIQLDDVADVTEETTAPTITRVDGLRSVTVSVTPSGDDLGLVGANVQEAVDAHDLPDSVQADLGGATEEMNDAFLQMGIAMLVAILLVFVIMVATFRSLIQPFILLVSIPFAATGSIGLLLLTDTPLGLTALIGLLMLIGVVVTNAIVLIDLINQFRDRGVDLRTAIVQGARLRYRPILMTAAATIFALIPMGMGLTGGGLFVSQSLAIVVIGGLVSSTILTLILVPVLYSLVEGVKERREEKRQIRDMTRDRAAATVPAGTAGDDATAGDAATAGDVATGTDAGRADGAVSPESDREAPGPERKPEH